MSDYIKHKEYKLPNGRTVTAEFNELGLATITIQAMNALFDILNSSDVVEVIRCKDCKWWDNEDDAERCTHKYGGMWAKPCGFCSYGERADA